MKKVKLKIEGMHCTSCAMNIDGDLEDMSVGIKFARTSYAKSETLVEFDEAKVNLDDIINTIKKTGYKAQLI